MKEPDTDWKDTLRQERDPACRIGGLPEETLVEIYRQKSVLTESGETPVRVVLSMERYKAVQDFRVRLGETPPGLPDYLGKYELFGLTVFIDDRVVCRVETEKERPR
jgi:hypothetical protein